VAQSPAVRVAVAVPIEREITDNEECTGHTEAVESVDIRARVTGYLDKVRFKDGAEVKEGDLLFEIDPRPFQAAYDQAVAQVKLREADRKFRLAELNRAKQLIDKNAISGSDYDQIVAQHDQAVAALAAAQADADSARLNLEFTKLASPIAGVTSRTQITRGNLVKADQTLLTSVVSVEPMYVYFDVDERTILEVQQHIREGKIKLRDKEKETIPVTMAVANQDGFPHQGVIDFGENRFDQNTGTVRVRAVFPNPKPAKGTRVLTPGLFARVRIPLGEPYKSLVVAERAIGADQGQKYVLVVNDKNEVEYRRVTLGKLENRLRVITDGLQAGQRVIVSGLQRVRPGSIVEPKLVNMEN
jgi:RND family efflux transporter MFP subunit